MRSTVGLEEMTGLASMKVFQHFLQITQMAPKAKKEKKVRRVADVVSREYTIHLHKRLHGL